MLTFECLFCPARFADLEKFCSHVGQRHGIRACQPAPERNPVPWSRRNAERVRLWREGRRDDPAYRERERQRVAAYQRGGRSG